MSSGNQNSAYYVAFARLPKLGPKGFALLRSHFPTMAEAWQASAGELKQAGLETSLVQAIIAHRQKIDVAASYQEIEKLQLEVVTIADPIYPKLLKEIYDPPALLFIRGDLKILENLCLAIVGSRRATSYGLTMAREIANTLAQVGVTIISGLAYGIDASAHKATIEAGGKTAAVMASGLDQIYHSANHKLANEILDKGGLWISEFPPQTAPLKQNFPFRNRIIAGLAQGTIVIEAAKTSGALLTAKHALEANREVFAVPGNATSPASVGTNELLKQGAHLITEASDVLSAFGLKAETTAAREPLTADLQSLLEKLPYEPTHLETLVRLLNLPASNLTSGLTLLELKGYLKDEGSGRYRRLK
ncbi:MAG: DNA protecting protein DprA [Candidatus Veblenbacteria bacterium RIFOXYC1_FULL_42_9]|uniref:DNA protecting protein DprA n=1 Tax=Candidatus Veblenbacteria bacterium RIFOXYC1_FULL_42_9 TaxID=1802427 RepID=A0A1G2Q3M6_9BACT|nr:MAG: DNA protecting protein DprA [Candidatus Veblenbacteria bacterium RIFOXYC1_FULL_42_9]